MPKFLSVLAGIALVLTVSAAAKERSELEKSTIKAATDCVAAAALNNSNIVKLFQQNRLKKVTDWIVLKSDACDDSLRAMRLLHDEIYGEGTGRKFPLGDYLADLPRAVGERIKNELEKTNASMPPLPSSAGNTGPQKHFVNHNDSVMLMEIGNAIGGISALKIYYQTPGERMSQLVNRGDLFFDGSLQWDTHEVAGNARIYKCCCDPLEYQVKGTLSGEPNAIDTLQLEGWAPAFGEGCSFQEFVWNHNSRLTFEPIFANMPVSPIKPDPVYSVSGLALGARVDFDGKAYQEYRCGPSNVFGGFTWCQKRTKEKEKRGPFQASYSILHSRDGTALYVNRFQEPAYWDDDEVKNDIDRYARRIGEQPRILKMPARPGFPKGVIATWGKVSLEPVDGESLKILATGKSPKIGVLIDFIGNYERSAKNDLPVYRLEGGPGFVWAASFNSNGRGTLRFLAINPSALSIPVNLAPPNQPPVSQPPANPVPPAQKAPEAAISTGTGFFVSDQGHILTNAHVVSECRDITSSHGAKITKLATDEASDLALLASSKKPDAWASLRGGRGPRVAETVMAIGFPYGGHLSSDPTVTTGIISALAGIGNDRRIIQMTAPVQPGNSGGPLLGWTGSVVGIVVGKLNAIKIADETGDIPQNINFAVSLGTIQSFLNTHGVPYVLDDRTDRKDYADIATEAMRYTVLLKCSR